MKKQLIKLGDQVLALPGLRRLFLDWTRNRIPIFLFHRAARPEHAIHGYDIAQLMAFLDALEARGIRIISLQKATELAAQRRPPEEPVVAFTADDGYVDQATVLGQAFAERGTPLAIFLITDFVDGKSWTWDAKVAHAFAQTMQSSADVDIGRLKFHFDLSSPERKTLARREFQLICKRLESSHLDAAIASLCDALEVSLPALPPAHFAPMSWDQARALEERGISFGPHSCSHRVMSRLPAAEIEQELAQSWGRVSKELANPLKVIAWPIGQNEDFGHREIEAAKSLGYRAAVAARHQVSAIDSDSDTFLLDRLGFSADDGGAASWRAITGVRRLNPLTRKRQDRRLTDMNAMAGVEALARPKFRKRTRIQSILASAAGLLGWPGKPGRRSLSDVQRIIFVCQGNICRSPYAAGLVRQLGVSALSCGLEANNIASADEIGARIAFGRGIDLSEHISSNIDQLQIGRGDLLLGMQPTHLRALKQIADRTGAHASLLGLWSRPSRPWIEDPFGLAPEAFERVFRQIEDATYRLLADLQRMQEDPRAG